MCEFNVFRGVQEGGWWDLMGCTKKKGFKLKGGASQAKNIGFKGGGSPKQFP